MPLPGVTPFPPEFAARYRDRGYWDDQPLFEPFTERVRQLRRPGRGHRRRRAPIPTRSWPTASAQLARDPARPGLRAAGPDRRAAAEHGGVRLPLLRAAADRGAPCWRCPAHRKREITPVRRDLRGAGAGHARGRRTRLRLHRDGGRGHGDEPGPGAVLRAGRGRPAAGPSGSCAWRSCWNASRGHTAPTLSAPGQHRPGRPGAVPALRRHHRDPQAHPPHPQRLPVQLQDRRGGVRDRRGRRAARRAADRAQPAARLPGHAGLPAVRRDRRAGHEHPAPGRVRADPAAPGHAHPPGARAADPVDRRPGHQPSTTCPRCG